MAGNQSDKSKSLRPFPSTRTTIDLKAAGLGKDDAVISHPQTKAGDGEAVFDIKDGEVKFEKPDGTLVTVSRMGPHPIKAAFGYKEGRVKVRSHNPEGRTKVRKIHTDSTRAEENARKESEEEEKENWAEKKRAEAKAKASTSERG